MSLRVVTAGSFVPSAATSGDGEKGIACFRAEALARAGAAPSFLTGGALYIQNVATVSSQQLPSNCESGDLQRVNTCANNAMLVVAGHAFKRSDRDKADVAASAFVTTVANFAYCFHLLSSLDVKKHVVVDEGPAV